MITTRFLSDEANTVVVTGPRGRFVVSYDGVNYGVYCRDVTGRYQDVCEPMPCRDRAISRAKIAASRGAGAV